MDHPSIEAIFDDLARSALASDDDWSAVNDRVWGYARSIPVFLDRPAHGVERQRELEPSIRRLRTRALALLNGLPASDRSKRAYVEEAERRGPSLTFRPWRPTDVDTYRELLDDPDLWRLLPEEYPGPLDHDTALAWIEHSNGSPLRHEVFAVESDGAVIGQARLQFDSDPDPASAEISYWIGRPFRGRGLGSLLVREFTSSGFKARKGLDRIFARVLAGNTGSLKVLERARYRPEGYVHRAHQKEGAWFGEHVLGAYRIDHPASGTPFRRVGERRAVRERRLGAERRETVRVGAAKRRSHQRRRLQDRRRPLESSAAELGRWSTRPAKRQSSRRSTVTR